MPEAALARELDINYAHCAVSVNWAAGRGDELMSESSIVKHTEQGMIKVQSILAALMTSI
jgi:purine nucleoside phosphorylase